MSRSQPNDCIFDDIPLTTKAADKTWRRRPHAPPELNWLCRSVRQVEREDDDMTACTYSHLLIFCLALDIAGLLLAAFRFVHPASTGSWTHANGLKSSALTNSIIIINITTFVCLAKRHVSSREVCGTTEDFCMWMRRDKLGWHPSWLFLSTIQCLLVTSSLFYRLALMLQLLFR